MLSFPWHSAASTIGSWMQQYWYYIFLGLSVLSASVAAYHWWRNRRTSSAELPPSTSPENVTVPTVVPIKSLPTLLDLTESTPRKTLGQILEKNRFPAMLTIQKAPAKVATRQQVPIAQLPFTLGRADCDLTIPEPSVSRQHAKIVQYGDKFYLIDLQSSNFTFISGKKVQAGRLNRLRPNSTITLGRSTVLKFEV